MTTTVERSPLRIDQLGGAVSAMIQNMAVHRCRIGFCHVPYHHIVLCRLVGLDAKDRLFRFKHDPRGNVIDLRPSSKSEVDRLLRAYCRREKQEDQRLTDLLKRCGGVI
jgi:hypothetical protein